MNYKPLKVYSITIAFIISIFTGCETKAPAIKEEKVDSIAFNSSRDGDDEIFLMDIEGKNLVQLTHNSIEDYHPSWSPDGKRIAFASGSDVGTTDIYIMNADGRNQKRLTTHPSPDGEPAWSPDGERIAFVSYRNRSLDIYVIDADGENEKRLTNNPEPDANPSWSPDGKKIVFNSGHPISEIYTIDVENGDIVRLTHNNFVDWNPFWSPDGKTIAFISEREGDKWPHIYFMDTDGKNQRRFTPDEVYGAWYPSWSPDSKKIVYSAALINEVRPHEIYIIDIETKKIKRLTHDRAWDERPSWRPSP